MKKLSAAQFSKELVSVLPQVMRGVLARQSDALTRGKVTAPQFLVLDFIYNKGPVKMSVLARALAVSLPAMSGLVNRLHKMKMVLRLYEEQDRRIIKIQLTTKGTEIVKTFRIQREKILAEIFGQLAEKDRRDYLRIILKVKDILYKKGD